MINKFAHKIAVTMGAQLQVDRDKVDVFAYGLEIILGALVQLTLLIWLSLIMDVFTTTMICMVAFASLRCFGGGIHLSTYSGCLIVGITMLLALGKLATIAVGIETLVVISIATLLMGIFTTFKWVPAGTAKKQIKDRTIRLRQRKKTFLTLIVWSIIILLLITQQSTAHAFAAVLGAFSSLFLITPWGYGAVQALENILKLPERGVNDV